MSLLQKTTVFADGLDHPECVAVHRDRSVWAGGEAGQVYKISADGAKVEQVANTKGFILGIAFSPDSSWLLVCDSANKCLWKLDTATYQLTKFAESGGGHSFNIPNYACFDHTGNVYVSESGAFRKITGKILKFDATGKGEVWSEGPFNFSNGMAIDAREEFIYVVCTFMPGIERIEIQKNGSAGKRELFATLPESVPDGAAFDAAGNLLVSCYAPNKIYTISPDRNVTVLVDDWEAHTLSNPTNIAFGGSNFDELFVANIGRWHIAKISLGIKRIKTCVSPMKDFNGKHIVVTGGVKGIGLATVEVVVREGANVSILDIDPAGITLETQSNGKILFINCNVANSKSVEESINKAIGKFGEVDVLVNNAGINRYATVTQTTEEDWDLVMNVNLKSAFLAAKYAIPSMQKKGAGVVINVSSVQAFVSQSQVAAYTTSKTAMLGLTRSIAVDYGPEIRCVAVCPGSVNTPMLQTAINESPNPEEVFRECEDMHLVKKVGDPKEVGEFIAFLASSNASFMTGQAYRIDGGLGVTIAGSKKK